MELGRGDDRREQDEAADQDDLHGEVVFGAVRVGDGLPPPGADVPEPLLQPVPDGGKRTGEAHDPARGDGSRPDVEDIGTADLRGAHVADRNRSGGQYSGNALSEELDQGNEKEVGQDPARAHHGSDPRPDDVADAEELRRDLGRDRARPVRGAEDLLGSVLP